MSVLDNIVVAFFSAFTAIFISLMHGASLEIENNLPAFLQGGLFIQSVNIGFPLLESLCILVFFLMYVISTINAFRTQTTIELIGVQLLYGIFGAGLLPIISNIYFRVTGIDAMFSASGTVFTFFFENLPLYGLVFFVLAMIGFAWGGGNGKQ